MLTNAAHRRRDEGAVLEPPGQQGREPGEREVEKRGKGREKASEGVRTLCIQAPWDL